MEFSNGGKISSPAGFVIDVAGTTLTMTPGGLEISAPFISLRAATVDIQATGEVTVGGALIKLN